MALELTVPEGDSVGGAGVEDPTNAVEVDPNDSVGTGRVGEATPVLEANLLLGEGEDERLGEVDTVSERWMDAVIVGMGDLESVPTLTEGVESSELVASADPLPCNKVSLGATEALMDSTLLGVCNEEGDVLGDRDGEGVAEEEGVAEGPVGLGVPVKVGAPEKERRALPEILLEAEVLGLIDLICVGESKELPLQSGETEEDTEERGEGLSIAVGL